MCASAKDQVCGSSMKLFTNPLTRDSNLFPSTGFLSDSLRAALRCPDMLINIYAVLVGQISQGGITCLTKFNSMFSS